MNRFIKSACLALLITLTAMTLISAAGCEGNSEDPAEVFVPTRLISFQALFSGGPNVQVNAPNVNTMLGELYFPDGVANTVSIDYFRWRIILGMVCMGAGVAELQYFTQTPLSFDIEFNGCMNDRDNGIVSGNMTLRTDPTSVNLLNVSYINMVAMYQGVLTPPITADINYFTMRTGDLLGYILALPDIVVVGLDAQGVLCNATVTPDAVTRTWTSDQGCALPAGPIGY